MTREFPDELLSAFLDDELNPAERAQVETHLEASPADRQLLAELKSLKGELTDLPPITLRPDFADRVVRAALAEAEQQNGALGIVSQAPPRPRLWRRWKNPALAAALALAASLLLIVQVINWRDAPALSERAVIGFSPATVQVASLPQQLLPQQFLTSLQSARPGNGEAVVLRLKCGKDVPLSAALEAALAKAGISAKASDAQMADSQLQDAYTRSLEARYADKNDELLSSTVAAAEAVFIECPLKNLEGALKELSAALKDPVRIRPEGKLALARWSSENQAEGESPSQPFCAKLNASFFRMQRQLADAAASAIEPSSPTAPYEPPQRIRVLLLIEPVE